MQTDETSRRSFLRMAAGAAAGFMIPGWLPGLLEAACQVGDVPSDISLSDVRGNLVAVPSDFARQVVLIHFWASWCPACRGEMQTIEALYLRYGKEGFRPCSIGLGESRKTAVPYLTRLDISYPVLLDPALSTKKLFGVAGVPTTFVLDRRRVIRHRFLGKADPAGLEKTVKSIL